MLHRRDGIPSLKDSPAHGSRKRKPNDIGANRISLMSRNQKTGPADLYHDHTGRALILHGSSLLSAQMIV